MATKTDQAEVKRKPSRKYSQDFSGNSLTQQQFRESSDVNNIVKHYETTGFDPYAARRAAQTFGFATAKSFSEAMQNVAEVESAFAELPSETRSAFANDPARWLAHTATQDKAPPEIVQEAASEAADPVAEPQKGDQSDQMDII